MFEAEFTHEGDRCTFEVLTERAGIKDPALISIAEIVHDIDLKDAKFKRQEALGIEHLIAGIAMSHKEMRHASPAVLPCSTTYMNISGENGVNDWPGLDRATP